MASFSQIEEFGIASRGLMAASDPSPEALRGLVISWFGLGADAAIAQHPEELIEGSIRSLESTLVGLQLSELDEVSLPAGTVHYRTYRALQPDGSARITGVSAAGALEDCGRAITVADRSRAANDAVSGTVTASNIILSAGTNIELRTPLRARGTHGVIIEGNGTVAQFPGAPVTTTSIGASD